MPACPPTCLPICLSSWLPARTPAHLRTCLFFCPCREPLCGGGVGNRNSCSIRASHAEPYPFVFLFVCLPAWRPSYLHAWLPACLSVCLPACLPACTPAGQPVRLPVCLPLQKATPRGVVWGSGVEIPVLLVTVKCPLPVLCVHICTVH